MKSQWISFEGGEGSGKTTVMAILEHYFQAQGYEVLCTREPGGVKIAEQIRAILLDVANTNLDPITESLLFAAARRQHLIEKVLPAMEEGKVILMDRYVDSSLAYQGYARGLGVERIRTLNDFAIEGHLPDITFYIDVPPKIGLERIRKNGREEDRLDLEAMEFHLRVREGYLSLAEADPRIVTIDGENTPQHIAEEIIAQLQSRSEES